MSKEFKLRLEVPFSPPDDRDVVVSRLKAAINEAVVESGIEAVTDDGKVKRTYGQELPSPDEVKEVIGLITAVVKLMVVLTPIVWPHIKAFIERLRAKMQHDPAAAKIRIDIIANGREIHLDGLTESDAFALFIGECEVIFQSRSEG